MPKYTFEVNYVQHIYRNCRVTIEAETEEQAKEAIDIQEEGDLLDFSPDSVFDEYVDVEAVHFQGVKE